jgi:hypothetical protein
VRKPYGDVGLLRCRNSCILGGNRASDWVFAVSVVQASLAIGLIRGYLKVRPAMACYVLRPRPCGMRQ